jgi:hypothetical protein
MPALSSKLKTEDPGFGAGNRDLQPQAVTVALPAMLVEFCNF